MKKRILFVGLLLSVMCMLSSCLVVYSDDKDYGQDYSKDVIIKNDLGQNAEIAKVWYKYTEDIPGVANPEVLIYDDGYKYTTNINSIDRAAKNQSISINLPYSDRYNFKVMLYYPDEGHRGVDGTFEYRECNGVYIDTKSCKTLSLKNDFWLQ